VGKPDVRNFRGGAGNRAMADLNRHEAGNGIDFLGYFRCRVFEELEEVERFRGLGVEGLRR